MEEIKNENHHDHSHCGMCPHKESCHQMCAMGGCGGMRFRVLRWVLGIIIILLSIWLGTKIGEFKIMCGGGMYGGGAFHQTLRF
jgi:hypothetical protein